ncbi:MAG: hypothetical protein APR54_02225 [Candidatus Cloacimonas sp. SDB]|nr:MAG: hypothetical protein APR54_02225 [Candidatus Cloacimonas sp. SDB]
MNFKKNYDAIKNRIKYTCESIGRDPTEVQILAVTKTVSVENIDLALKSGISLIGENKVQEAEAKLPLLQEKYREFHFIGHLQSNKINKLLPLKPDLIHSIDSLSTLKKLNHRLQELSRIQDVLLQVNTSGEYSKFGITPEETESFLKQSQEFEHIRIKGLMTIGMFTTDVAVIRKCFRTLYELFHEIKTIDLANSEMKYLSMGMSNDYEIAIEEGANILRIGTAIFGTRN